MRIRFTKELTVFGKIWICILLLLTGSFKALSYDGEYINDADEKELTLNYQVVSESNKTVEIVGAYYKSAGLENIVIKPVITKKYSKTKYKVIGITRNVIQSYTKTVDMSQATNLEYIGESCFQLNASMTAFESFDFSGLSNLKKIGKRAFYQEVPMPNVTGIIPYYCSKLEEIGDEAFAQVSLESVYGISHKCTTLRSIGKGAFKNTNLADIDLGSCSNLSFIGEGAFQNTDLAEIAIHHDAPFTKINDYLFYGCSKLKKVDIDFSKITYIGNYSFYQCRNMCDNTDLSMEKLPNIETIGSYAFYYTNLKGGLDFNLCPKLKTIQTKAFASIKDVTYANLSNLTSLKTVGDGVFDDCPHIEYIDFSGCTALTELPEMGRCWAIKSISFNGCSSIKLNKGLHGSFTYLETVDFSGIKVKEIPDNFICQVGSLKSIKIDIDSTLVSIGNRAFYNNRNLKLDFLDLSNYRYLQKIGDNAFSNIRSLRKVDLEGAIYLKSIGAEAFSGCTNLEEVSLKDCRRLQTIGDGAFRQTAITEIGLPASLIEIGKETFLECRNLKYVVCEAVAPPKGVAGTSSFSAPMTTQGRLYVPNSAPTPYHATWPWSEIETHQLIGSVDKLTIETDKESYSTFEPIHARLKWIPECSPSPKFIEWIFTPDRSSHRADGLEAPNSYDDYYSEDPLYEVTYLRDGSEATIIPKWKGEFRIEGIQYSPVLSGSDDGTLAVKKVAVEPVKATSFRFEKEEYTFHIDDDYPIISIIPEPADASSDSFFFWRDGGEGYETDRLVGPYSVKLNLNKICETEYPVWIVGENNNQDCLQTVKINIVNSRPESVKIIPASTHMDDGTEQILRVEYEPSQAYVKRFKWEITNNKNDFPKAELIETEDADKVILKALRAGEVNIKVYPEGAPDIYQTQKITIDPVRIESIKISDENRHFKKSDGNIRLQFTTVPENATVYNVSCSVDDDDIAEVVGADWKSKSVEIKPKSIGETVVHLVVEGTTVKYGVTPIVIDHDHPVENITLSHDNLLFNGNSAMNVSIVAIEPENADLDLISWKADAEGLITIEMNDDRRGATIRSQQPGTCNLVVTTDAGRGITKRIPVEVKGVDPEKIVLDSSDISLSLYSKPKTVTAAVTPMNALPVELIWMSTNENIFTIESILPGSARLQAKQLGTARLIVYEKNNPSIKTETMVSVTDIEPFTTLKLEQSQFTVSVRENPFRLGVVYAPENAQPDYILWESSNVGVAVADASGMITPVASGRTMITARTSDGSGLISYCELIVTDMAEENEFGLTVDKLEVEPGEVFTLEALLASEEIETEWRIADGSVVERLGGTDRITGRFLALKEGETTIELTSVANEQLKASCSIIVTPAMLKGIKIERNFDEINIMEGVQRVRAVLDPYYFEPKIRWSSSDESVAMIEAKDSGFAHITPLRQGMTTIRAEHTDYPGISDSYLLYIDDMATGVEEIGEIDDNKTVSLFTITGLLIRDRIRIGEMKNLDAGIYIIVDEKGARKIIKP